MAEELRELRLSKQIPAKDMVAVVQQIYPKYDKTVQSKCENGEVYGCALRALRPGGRGAAQSRQERRAPSDLSYLGKA